MALLQIFTDNILPILLLSGAGFLLGSVLKLDSRPLGRVIFYILGPILIFNLLTTSQLKVENILIMMGYSLSVMLISGGIAFLIGKLFRLEIPHLTIVLLTTLFGNNGNYGLPLISFAFGETALTYASIYFVTNSLMLYTLGVVIASLGHLKLKDALIGLVKVPAVYAILLALLFIYTGWQFPIPIKKTISLAAGGAIPAMLILLGLELQKIEWTHKFKTLSIPVFVRLFLGPFIGMAIAMVYGLGTTFKNVGTVQGGMPSAVMTTILANEYKLDTSLVTAIVFVSTILSPLTLTPLIYFLRR